MRAKLTVFERTLSVFSPERAQKRAVARLTNARNYNAASQSRRTAGWPRTFGDVNSVNARALVELRLHARDLMRNNAWAARAVEVITGNAVSWGISARASDGDKATASDLWRRWADSTECDTERRLTFAGIQELVFKTVITDGECLIRRRFRRPEDGLSIPLQLQILEADYLDTTKDGVLGPAGGPIVQGVEFDKIGRRVAYWLFTQHPGAGSITTIKPGSLSVRVSASELIHVFRVFRPGQVRGVSWLAQTIAPLKDFDEYEGASLVKQKVAACFSVFITDTDGTAHHLLEQDDFDLTDDKLEMLEPGTATYLSPGRDVKFATPPVSGDDSFTTRNLRRISQGMGITYEDLTGDYNNVNFSSARMARIAHWNNVRKWQWNMIIPLLCDGVWAWAMDAATAAGDIKTPTHAKWTVPPMPMLEPDKEGLAVSRLIRNGLMTPSQAVQEQGLDPETHFEELAADMKKLQSLGLVLDCDASAVTQAGMSQAVNQPKSDSGNTEAERLALQLVARELEKLNE